MMDDDEWSAYVSNGEAFNGEGLQGAVAGQIAHVQIFNPVASGVRVRMRHMEPIPVFGIAINTNPRRHDVALTSNVPFAGPTNLLGSGGAAANVQLRNVSQVGSLGSPFYLFLSTGFSRKTYPVKALDWGHDLLPGQGLVLQSGVGGFMIVGFEWAELPL